MADIIKSLNKKMPPLINKDGEEYKAVIGNEKFTPEAIIIQSSDYKCGAIANELEFLRLFINYAKAAYNVETTEEGWIDVITEFFLNMSRLYQEEDENLINRFFSITKRKNFPKWMVPLIIKKVFSYFFNEDDIFIINNYIESNLISNSDFEDGTGNDFDDWTEYETGDSHIIETTTEHLEQARAVEFQISSDIDNCYILQTITSVVTGFYKFSMFYKDDGLADGDDVLTLIIRRSGDSLQYNPETQDWEAGYRILIPKKGTDYKYFEIFVVLPSPRDLTFIIASESFYLDSTVAYKVRVDKVEFGEWFEEPSVKALIVSNYSPGGYANIWPSGADPLGGGENYDYASFLDNDFISGEGNAYPVDFFEDLLDRIRVAGVKPAIEILPKYGG